MIRTQVYLTERQHTELAAISRSVGKTQSELIREAVDQLIDQMSSGWREKVLREAAGMWEYRTDLPDARELRADWDREE